MFNKILIANRGEIACRVMHTAQKLGVSTVSVFSDADRSAKHVQLSDEGYHIGGSTPLESYLKMENVLDAALKSGAQGIHPGYGFLSENPTFTDMCEQAGVKFIGPPSSAMIKMASKSESKDIMIAAGVPVTPGYHGENQDPEFLLEKAKEINFPVMIKAVMGGGGKGMKISRSEEDFFEQLESAKRESRNAFDDEEVLIEKYIERPKHYEIQVFGDSHGNYVYLFERDCSIQRRHQKIIEEAPSAITPEQRQDMGTKACEAARAVGYVNAGTVEFLYDCDTQNFYFMEMNTRLQVEHPISEEITGVDLVEWQLKVASGEPLPLTQDQLRINGHAIEARVYSEDPFTFLPGRGTVDYYREPDFARVDSGVQQGTDVGIFYDPMISKLIVWGEDRNIAVQKMRKAISEYKIGGLVTNLPFLKRVIDHPEFAHFDYDLQFIDQYQDILIPEKMIVGENQLLSAIFLATNFNNVTASQDLPSDFTNFRVNHSVVKSFSIDINYAYSTNTAYITLDGSITHNIQTNTFSAQFDIIDPVTEEVTKTLTFEDLSISFKSATELEITRNSQLQDVEFYEKEGEFFVFDREGNCYRSVNQYDLVERIKEEVVDTEQIRAPMPGVVTKVLAAQGDAVQKGTTVAVMEAMKMEHQIKAGADIVIEDVLISPQEFVEAGQPLFKLKQEE